MDKLYGETRGLHGAISFGVEKAVRTELDRNFSKIRKLTRQLSVKLKKAKLTCSAEAQKPAPKNQDDQDPDHPEGEKDATAEPKAKSTGVVIVESAGALFSKPPVTEAGGEGKGKEVTPEIPLTEEEQLALAIKQSLKEVSGAGRTGSSLKIGESSKAAEDSSTGTFDTLHGTIKPIVSERSSQKILEEDTAHHDQFFAEDVADQPQSLPLPRDRVITSPEEAHKWKYSTRDIEPPFDPTVSGIPNQEAKLKFSGLIRPSNEVYSELPISSIKTISPRTLCQDAVHYAQFTVVRTDGLVYTFTDADFHNLCIYDLPLLCAFLSKRMEISNKYADSQSRLWHVMRAQVFFWSQKDFDIGYRLGQNKMYCSPPNNRPLWIKDIEPNTLVQEPEYGFVYEDKDGVKRFFNHLEGNKYMHKSLVFIYKILAREVKEGRLHRDLAEPIHRIIEAASKFRSLIFNMYTTLRNVGFDDFPNARIKQD
jgi:hypothetical protein